MIVAAAAQLLGQMGPNLSRQSASADSLVNAAAGHLQSDPDLLGVLVAVAYPDRIALRRDSSNRCDMLSASLSVLALRGGHVLALVAEHTLFLHLVTHTSAPVRRDAHHFKPSPDHVKGASCLNVLAFAPVFAYA